MCFGMFMILPFGTVSSKNIDRFSIKACYLFSFFIENLLLFVYFIERYDIMRIIKRIERNGLYVNLRIRPYVCA